MMAKLTLKNGCVIIFEKPQELIDYAKGLIENGVKEI